MEDNHYKADALQVHENAMAVATEKLAIIESKLNVKPIAFIAENYKNKKIRERTTEPNFKMLIGLVMTKVCALAGIRNEITDFDKQDIVKMIFTRFDDLSAEELAKAFELERYSVYDVKTDHFQLFNAMYVGEVLKKYKNWKRQIAVNHNINSHTAAALSKNTDSASRETLNKGILSRFEQFKNGEPIETPIHHIFEDLKDRSLFPDDMPDAEIYKVAVREIKAELEQTKATSKSERRDIKEALANIEKNMVNANALTRAKLLAIEYFFKKCIDEKIDLENLITKK